MAFRRRARDVHLSRFAFRQTPALCQAATRIRLERAKLTPAAAYIQAKREVERLRCTVDGVSSSVDLLTHGPDITLHA